MMIDPAARPVRVRRMVEHPAEIDRLASYFPDMGWPRLSVVFMFWRPCMAVRFTDRGGRVLTVHTNYRHWNDGKGCGDGAVRGDLAAFARGFFVGEAGREARRLEVPSRLRVEREAERISVAVDPASLETVSLEVGRGMVTGFKHQMRVYRVTGDREELLRTDRSGLGGSPDIGTGYLNRSHDGIPRPGEQYVVEVRIELFETDIPPHHFWSPESGWYRILWARTLRQKV